MASKRNPVEKYKEENDEIKNIDLEKNENAGLENINNIEIRQNSEVDVISGINQTDFSNHLNKDTDMTLNSIRELIFGISIESSPQEHIISTHALNKKIDLDAAHKQSENDYSTTPIVNSVPSNVVNVKNEVQCSKNDHLSSMQQYIPIDIQNKILKSRNEESEILDIQKYMNLARHEETSKNEELNLDIQNEPTKKQNLD